MLAEVLVLCDTRNHREMATAARDRSSHALAPKLLLGQAEFLIRKKKPRNPWRAVRPGEGSGVVYGRGTL